VECKLTFLTTYAFRSLIFVLVIVKKILDPGSGKNPFRIQDPGGKKAPDPGSATLNSCGIVLLIKNPECRGIRVKVYKVVKDNRCLSMIFSVQVPVPGTATSNFFVCRSIAFNALYIVVLDQGKSNDTTNPVKKNYRIISLFCRGCRFCILNTQTLIVDFTEQYFLLASLRRTNRHIFSLFAFSGANFFFYTSPGCLVLAFHRWVKYLKGP
jgi:hypothetical protein